MNACIYEKCSGQDLKERQKLFIRIGTRPEVGHQLIYKTESQSPGQLLLITLLPEVKMSKILR